MVLNCRLQPYFPKKSLKCAVSHQTHKSVTAAAHNEKQPVGPTLDTQQVKMKRWFVCSENIHQRHGWLDVLMQTVHTCLFRINCPHTAGDYNNRCFINFILHCLLQRPHQSGTLPDQTSVDYCDKFCTPTRLKLRIILPSKSSSIYIHVCSDLPYEQ